MKYTLRFLLFLVICVTAAFSPVIASAASSRLKCNPQNDTVWVYDSLATLDVQAKVSCTETVEVLERINGYVKVRTQEGVEGYVPESAFSDLPGYQAKHDPTHDVGYVAKAVQAKEIAKAAAANSEFVTPQGNSADASAQASLDEAQKGGANRKTSASRSLLPNEMAEMSPRRPSSPVKKVSATFANAGPVTEPIVSSSAQLLDTRSPADPKPVTQPISAPVLAATSPAVAGDADAATEGITEYKLESASQDLACRSYFSAYGLTAYQIKWIAQNRKKAFPGVCPAPNVSKVDYVIIFTHDVGFFAGTLPDPVHNLNGFSDFRPMTPVDNALMSASDADKAHREYVWVFRVSEGGFNPEAFSPHRAFQFSKVETNSLGSKAGPKAVEDAFRFVEGADR